MKLMTVNEAAEYANCSASTIRAAAREGRLKVTGKVGNRFRFVQGDLDAFLRGEIPEGAK